MSGAIVPPSIEYAGRGQGAQTRIAAAFGRRHRRSVQTRGRHSGLPALDRGNHPTLRHSPWPSTVPRGVLQFNDKPRHVPQQAARNRPHRKYPLTPSIQLRQPCFSILAPLQCGLQAGNGHPAREFPPIRGSQSWKLPCSPSRGEGSDPETASGWGKMAALDAREFPVLLMLINDNKECRPVASPENVTETLAPGIHSNQRHFR